jgi:DNA-directed RNA polymerase specialized sigma24 family protein
VAVYRVRATRFSARRWQLDVDGYGRTYCRTLYSADAAVRDYLAGRGVQVRGGDRVKVCFAAGECVDAELKDIRLKHERALAQMLEAGSEYRMLARRLRRQGLSNPEIAAVFGISVSRTNDLVSGAKTAVARQEVMRAAAEERPAL